MTKDWVSTRCSDPPRMNYLLISDVLGGERDRAFHGQNAKNL